MRYLIVLLFGFISYSQTYQMPSADLAFPMAKGDGKYAKVPSSAQKIAVTSQTEYRDALQNFSTGRHIMITTGAVIDTGADMFNVPGNVFIHGEITPGTGATLTSQTGGTRFVDPNVIIRNVRFRGSGGSLSMIGFYNVNGVTIENGIIDRCSFNWPTGNNPNEDEMMVAISKTSTVAGTVQNFTIQRSIFAEGTRGVLISRGAEHVTLWQTYFYDPGFRTPISGYPFAGTTQRYAWTNINSLSHNPYQNMIAGVGTKVQIVGCKMTLSPGSQFPFQGMLRFESYGGCDGNCSSSTEGYIYLEDNSVPSGVNFVGGSDASLRVQPTPYEPLPVDARDILPVSQIDNMLSGIGAFPRDQYDTDYINHYLNNTGGQGVTSGTLNTGLYAAGTMPTDADGDWMADDWETLHGVSDPEGITTNWTLGGRTWVNHPTVPWTNLEIYWADQAGDWDVLEADIVGDTPVLPTRPAEEKQMNNKRRN